MNLINLAPSQFCVLIKVNESHYYVELSFFCLCRKVDSVTFFPH